MYSPATAERRHSTTLAAMEEMTFGPRLRHGQRTLLLVSDNNFAASQFTQFLLFAINGR